MEQTNFLQELLNNPINGVVNIPSGTYLTGPLFVKSNTTVHFNKDTILLATTDESKYTDIETRVAGIEMKWYPGILNIINAENVIINGYGTINGNDPYWWEKYWGKDEKSGMRQKYDAEGLRFACDYDCKRVRNIYISQS